MVNRLTIRISRKAAFTIIELLVVIFIISVLVSILIPALGRARQQARSALCRSNLRQIHLANTGYSIENKDFYVRAAFDMFVGSGGRNRWHGMRESAGVDPDPQKNTFDPLKGPLRAYLSDGRVKQCPQIVNFVKDGAENAFEAGCGGYGYNSVGVGSRTYRYGYSDQAMRISMRSSEINQANEKVMFTDTAFVEGFPDNYIIEYSFCEPPNFVNMDSQGQIVEAGRPAPSIHFRHAENANVVWCDGHVTGKPFAYSTLEQQVLNQFMIGWFDPDSNRVFRP